MAPSCVERTCDIPDATDPLKTHCLQYYQWGDEGKPPLLCVHGLTRNGRDFDHLAQVLCNDYHVICPDMPGRGKSEYLSNPIGYNYPAYVANIAALLAQRNITSLDWIGTSMGGIIGMMFANTFPGMINRFVINDIGTMVSSVGLKRILSSASVKPSYDTLDEAKDVLRERLHTFAITDERHWEHLFTYGLQQNEDGSYRLAYDRSLLAVLPNSDQVEDVDMWSLWPALSLVPILLIRGADSDILTRDIAMQMKAQHPNLTLHEIPDVGHAPALMSDDQINIITDWLD